MTKKKIRWLADYFYSSDSSLDVPCRISLSMGMGGSDLTKKQFVDFLTVLEEASQDSIRMKLHDFLLENDL